MNAGRAAKAAALLCFLLPWVTVSCAGRPLARMTGAGMATGKVESVADAPPIPGAGPNPLANLGESSRPDLLIAAAAVLILVGLVATFLLPRPRAAVAGMIGAVAAAALIGYEVLVRLPGALESRMSEATKEAPAATNDFERAMQQQLEQIGQAISIDPQIGFWLTMAALVAAAVLFKVVHGRRERSGTATVSEGPDRTS
jgi:lysylphosphatidylglycerol synthetase-like protein (DUF2156 family)